MTNKKNPMKKFYVIILNLFILIYFLSNNKCLKFLEVEEEIPVQREVEVEAIDVAKAIDVAEEFQVEIL